MTTVDRHTELILLVEKYQTYNKSFCELSTEDLFVTGGTVTGLEKYLCVVVIKLESV